ncbi:MAG: NUDIX hydrolase [Pseudomonadota bacterium]
MKKIPTYPGDYRLGEIEILEEVPVFENKYATLFNDKVKFPSGATGEYLRFCWNAPYGVMVIPFDHNGRLLLIRTFRHETRSWHWEIPKGFGEAELSPEQSAQKELYEETGYSAKQLKPLHTLNEKGNTTYVFKAVIEPGAPTSKSTAEVSEAIDQVAFFDPEQCRQLLTNDSLDDPITLYAALLASQA